MGHTCREESDAHQYRLDERNADDSLSDAANRRSGKRHKFGPTFIEEARRDRRGNLRSLGRAGEKHAGDGDRNHELQHSEAHPSGGREKPACEGCHMRPQLLQRAHQIDVRKGPEPVQLLANQRPRGNMLGRQRNFEGAVT